MYLPYLAEIATSVARLCQANHSYIFSQKGRQNNIRLGEVANWSIEQVIGFLESDLLSCLFLCFYGNPHKECLTSQLAVVCLYSRLQ